MRKFEASWFCHGVWAHMDAIIIANSSEEVDAYISKKYTKKEYRAIPYRKAYEDSLKIKDLGEITFPLEL